MLQISFLAFYANSLQYIHSLNDYISDIVFLSYSKIECFKCYEEISNYSFLVTFGYINRPLSIQSGFNPILDDRNISDGNNLRHVNAS